MSLTPDGYRKRLLDKTISNQLKEFGAISIVGPKWVGKTWTAENNCNSEFKLNDMTGAVKNLDIVTSDPRKALEGEVPHLIDEWQDYPAIWDLVRIEVDKKGKKGRYILTGSSVPKRDEYIHSGIGRIDRIHMHTMSLFETGDSDGSISLNSLFNGDCACDMIDCGEKKFADIVELCIRGGWPENVTSKSKNGHTAKNYIEMTVEDACRLDIRKNGTKRNYRKMEMLIKSLARNESTTASVAKLMNDMKEFDDENISKETFYDYFDCLDRLHLITNTPSFRPNVRSSMRIGKSPKRHLTDVSLAIAALEIDRKRLMNDMNTFGFMFESLCEHDLMLYAEANGGRLFHYRDNRDREMDAVVEYPDGRWGAFEIKVGAGQIDDAAKNLLKITEMLGGESTPPEFCCVICGLSRYAYRRPDGVFVVPITALGP